MAGSRSFSSDIFKLFFLASMDVQYIADYQTGQILMANPQFSAVLGWTQQDIASGTLFARDMIDPTERADYESRLKSRQLNVPEHYTLRTGCKNGDTKIMDFTVVVAEFEGRLITIGNARDVTDRTELQTRLQKENKRYRDLTYDTARANVRIYQLTEKIHRVPHLLGELIATSTENELFQKTAATLTDPQGLKYEQVAFMLLEDDEQLHVRYASEDVDVSAFNLGRDSLLAKIARGEITEAPEHDEYYIEPITGFEDIRGVVLIYFDPQEKILFDENNRIKSSQRDLVRTLTQCLGMQLQNIRLFDKVRKQSITDQITGLFNRRYFENKIKDEVQRALRYNRELSLVHIDLDGFKEVNDTLGHLQGDLVLADVSKLLRTVSRESDIVCRVGGDEFLIILPETNPRDALFVATKILEASRAMDFTRVKPDVPVPPITFSMGVASTSTEIDTHEKLYAAADVAMYESKFAGKNRVTMSKQVRDRLEESPDTNDPSNTEKLKNSKDKK